MPNYYNSIDVIIVASSNEGLCRPILEAASCGKGIISTNVGIAEEFLSNNNGFLIDKNKFEERNKLIDVAVNTYKDNPELVRIHGKINREIILSEWTWEKRIIAWKNFFMQSYEKKQSK